MNDNGYEHIIKTDGVSAFVFDVWDDGREITISGWRGDRSKFKKGQRVLVVTAEQESRYRVVENWCPDDPSDQYFLRCKYDPRGKR